MIQDFVSKEFLQDLPARRVTAVVANTLQKDEKKGGFNGYQKFQIDYEDLTHI